jgi:hypothetical protein
MDTIKNHLLSTTSSLEPLMPPATSSFKNWREYAVRIAGLLSHYWTTDDDRATRRAQIHNWIEDLKEYPLGAVEGALITWRRSQTKRPTPADIRRLIEPDPKPQTEGGAAYKQFPKSKLTQYQLQKHRQSIAKYWDLVRRARNGEDPEMLIAERKRSTAEDYDRDPELQIINAIIVAEEKEEREDWFRQSRRLNNE